jgi:hypothetical protein
MAGSSAAHAKKPPKPTNGLTHRDVWAANQKQAQSSADWAAVLENAVLEGIDNGLPDSVLEGSVKRILELQEQAKEREAAAREAEEARVALSKTPIKTPVTKANSKSAKRAAIAGRIPLGEGSLVQLKGLDGVCGLGLGCFDVNLEEYNGRKGRVSKGPPPWVIKAVGQRAGEQSAQTSKVVHDSGGLVPVLLDSRSTDADRHRGVWVAVPPGCLKVLSSL